MWKVLAESARGTSHAATNLECQDVVRFTRIDTQHGEYLVLVCADGAGSAAQAQLGATTACESILRSTAKELSATEPTVELTDALLRDWVTIAHNAVDTQAAADSLPPRDYACTLLLAVLGPTSSAFAQIGDGAIVTGEDDTYTPIFWPDSGEYQNTTYFLCESTYAEHLHVAIGPAVKEVAMLTDGLQMLALRYADKAVHSPFFVPMFRALRAGNETDLSGPLRSFLDSPAVNARTDDDKTLILATQLGQECADGHVV